MAAQTPARRAFLQLMTAVAVLHLSAIAAYYTLDIPQAGSQTQRLFAWAWIILSAIVVLVGLQRLKRARRAR